MTDPNKISTDFFEFTYNEESSEWLYKALPIKAIKIAHGEKPHYKVVEELEEHYSNELEQCLANALKDIVRYLNVNATTSS